MRECPRAELIRLMVGREIQSVYPTRQSKPGDVVLEVTGVNCRESGVTDARLSVRAGEILGLAGLVGAGRTELARVLFGLTPADRDGVNTNASAIRMNGLPVWIESPADAVRLGLAYVPEDRRRHGVVGEMSVAANVTLACLRSITRGTMLDSAREREIAQRYSQRFAIKAASIDSAVDTLSGGNQQKVALARWLATEPKVLILDEPTQGVDVGAKSEIHGLIADLAARGLAIILISSELPELLGMCDRIAVMHAGTIVATLDRDAATQERILTLALGHDVEPPQPPQPPPPREVLH
jgi:rhamnose transport system ATP-binding protein